VASGTSTSPVPRLIKFSGILLDHQGQPLKGPVGVTFSLSGKLNLLFASGTGTPVETGLSIANNGRITFATALCFPPPLNPATDSSGGQRNG